MAKYQDLPYNYLHCLAGNEACPRKGSCLRAEAARMLEEGGHCSPAGIQVLNPNIARNAGQEGCPFYRDSAPVTFARGMSRLFDEVPVRIAKELKERVKACFRYKERYYKCKKGEWLITPKEQEAVRRAFSDMGAGSPPAFDSYEEHLPW